MLLLLLPRRIIYGLATSQLGDVETPIVFGGVKVPISTFITQRFGYDNNLVWWMLLIVLAYILFFRVTSVLALKYKNFLRR